MSIEKTYWKQISFWIWIAVIVTELIGFFISVLNHGMGCFVYYTQQSNLILLIAALCHIAICIKNKSDFMPRWTLVLQYIATCLVAVTYTIVLFVLAPMIMPYGTDYVIILIFGEANLYHHTICPILAFVLFLGFEKRMLPGMREVFVATIPTLVYAFVSTLLNVLGVIRGPYPFLYVYEQPIWLSVVWFIVIPCGGFAIALLLSVVKKKIAQR